MKFENKVAMVTGGNFGLGRGISHLAGVALAIDGGSTASR